MEKKQLKINCLVVDDEAGVRRSLVRKLQRETKDLLFLIEEASNGEEAYDVLQNKQIDLLFLDMKMPGIGGMRFLELLKSQFPSVKVVVVSGYSDFQYVKHALKYGANDYLLKPTDKDELRKLMNKLIMKIELEQVQKKTESNNAILLKESLPLLKNHLLNRLIKYSSLEPNEILNKLNYLQININFNSYVLVLMNIKKYIKNKKETYFPEAHEVLTIIEEELGNEFKSEDKSNLVSFKSSIRDNEYICIVGLDNGETSGYKYKNSLKKFLNHMEKKRNFYLNIVVSDNINDVSVISNWYSRLSNNSMAAGENQETSSITFLDEISENTNYVPAWYPDIRGEDFKRLVKVNDTKNISQKLHSLFAQITNETSSSVKSLAESLYRIIKEIINDFPEYYRERANYKLPVYNHLVSAIDNLETTKFKFIKVFYEISNFYNKMQNQENVIYSVKEYIDEHFYEEITLEIISSKFYINPTYLSDQFKKEIGLNFKKYLNTVRIEKAKELLTEENIKPVWVAELVGYKDPIHFSQVFKKYTGVPPGKFQDGHKPAHKAADN